jgi:uncharacterized protein YndB with AHSA1/START domain
MTNHTFTADPNSQEIVTTYVFDAPRKQVFEAYTNPDLISKWWGPASMETKVETMEVKPGGSWQFVMSSQEGEFRFQGVYHGVTIPEKLIATWQVQGMPTVILQTVTFEEQPDGKTKVTDQMVFPSVADRDAMLAGGMDGGSVDSLERLAKLI